MAAIDNYLQQIRTAVYGRDVRSAIANGIEECYNRDQNTVVNNSVTVDGLSGTSINRTAICGTASNAVAKAASIISGTFSLTRGAHVSVIFSQANTVDSPTLNINSTGAKPIYVHGARMNASNRANISGVCDFVYDTATQAWHLVGGSDVAEEVDLSGYPTKTEMQSSISQAVAGVAVDLSPYIKRADADARYASSTINPFEYRICPNTASQIPSGVQNSSGTVGTLAPSNTTMYVIYLVPVRFTPGTIYDSYITVAVGNGYRWERIGGLDIDLSPYISAEQVAQDYATIDYVDTKAEEAVTRSAVDLSPYLKRTDADTLYASAGVNSFEYTICGMSAATIPAGVENGAGTVGTLAPSASTMYTIYLVANGSTSNHQYDSYITILVGNNYQWEKLSSDEVDLTEYMTQAQVAAAYATISYVDGQIESMTEQAAANLTPYLTKEEAASTYANININPFTYHICMNASNSIPYGVVNSAGTTGTLIAGETTMYDIYLVQVRDQGGSRYDEYVTLDIGGTYTWEKLGGQDFDLTAYLTAAQIAEQYVTISLLNSRLSSYLTATEVASNYVRQSTLADYATKQYVDSQVSQAMTGGELNLDNYVTKSDAAMTYATLGGLSALDAKINNITNTPQYLLESDNIPGTEQRITFNTNGDVREIRHIKNSQNLRVDTFTFAENKITEVRTLNTGEKLTIETNTNTLVTNTTYAAA